MYFTSVKSTEDFREMLKRLRKSQKVTIEELSQFSGLHRNGISKIEKEGSDPLISSALKLLELLGGTLYIGHPAVDLSQPENPARESQK